MSTANVKDPETVKRLFPREMFESAAAANSHAGARSLTGLRIETAPDAAGNFRLAVARRSTVDPSAETEAVFLCPFMGRAYGLFALRGGEKGAVSEARDIFAPHEEEYDAFIAAVLRAARDFRPPPPPDPNRLAGFGA